MGTPVLADINRGQSDSTKQSVDSEEILRKTSSKSSTGVLIAQGTKPRQGFWQRMAFWKRKPQVKQKGKRQGFLQRFNRKQKPTKVKRNKRQGFLQRMNVKRLIPTNFKLRRNKKQNG
jgi:ribosomal protein L34